MTGDLPATAPESKPDSQQDECVDFGGLPISYDPRVLTPRLWTVDQSRWAADLLRTKPGGPVLELCAGAGQIGLLAVKSTQRRLVCVDANPVAVSYARRNAERAGLADQVEVREGELSTALEDTERFCLAIADPPWVPTTGVVRFPGDPIEAIDGGSDGLEVARTCVAVLGRHVVPGGAALIQLGTPEQAHALESSLRGHGLVPIELREYDGRGVVLRADRLG